MVSEFKEKYTKKQRLLAKGYENIFDIFDDLRAQIEVFSYLDCDENKTLNYGVFLYVEEVQDRLKSLEFKVKKGILEGSLHL